jgi:hypothetical protein
MIGSNGGERTAIDFFKKPITLKGPTPLRDSPKGSASECSQASLRNAEISAPYELPFELEAAASPFT